VIPAASGLFDGLESLTNLIIQGIIDNILAVMNALSVAWSVYDLDFLVTGKFLIYYVLLMNFSVILTEISELQAIKTNIYYSSIWMYTAVKSTNLIILTIYPFELLYNFYVWFNHKTRIVDFAGQK